MSHEWSFNTGCTVLVYMYTQSTRELVVYSQISDFEDAVALKGVGVFFYQNTLNHQLH